ncbi:hypothetical protein Ciccas_004525 [Cichlidogyrus casuarinus]|uniref:Uncharacterized protein n=1 Tax=Cichlidogyrus casuarinus TaxID=1844966 RepID=A0ABD2QB81_9PLAT
MAIVVMTLLGLFLITIIIFSTFSCHWLEKRRRLRKRREQRALLKQKRLAIALDRHSTHDLDDHRTQNGHAPLMSNSNSTPKSGSSVLDDQVNGSAGSSVGRQRRENLAPHHRLLSTDKKHLSNSTLNLDLDLDSASTTSMAQDFLTFLKRIFTPRRWSSNKECKDKVWETKQQNHSILNASNHMLYASHPIATHHNVYLNESLLESQRQRLLMESLQQAALNTMQRPDPHITSVSISPHK